MTPIPSSSPRLPIRVPIGGLGQLQAIYPTGVSAGRHKCLGVEFLDDGQKRRRGVLRDVGPWVSLPLDMALADEAEGEGPAPVPKAPGDAAVKLGLGGRLVRGVSQGQLN